MSSERTNQSERLYERGMEAFRAARWEEAVEAFAALERLSSAYPEVKELLDEAQLKLDFARVEMPSGALPPRVRRVPAWAAGVIALGLVVSAGAAAYVFWPRPQPVAVAPAPTAAPTIEPTPEPLPTAARSVAPTAEPAPTTAPTMAPTAAPVVADQPPGELVVRMAEGQALTRTVRNIEIILDASGSMLAPIGSDLKIDIAHSSLNTLVQRLPDNTNVALRTYGHRRASDCSDMELVSPLAPLNRDLLVQQISAIRPVPNGRTPMAASIQAIRETLAGVQGDTLIVLVSDGDETCDGDPALAAAQLREEFPNVRVSVIGFNIEQETWRTRLQAIAEQGGGGYFDAADAAQLEVALQQAVALTYRVLSPTDEELFIGPIGAPAALRPGDYTVELSDETLLKVQAVQITSGQQTIVELSATGDLLSAQVINGQ